MKFAELSSETQIVLSGRALAWMIHGRILTRSASEGVVKVRPRLRFLKLRIFYEI